MPRYESDMHAKDAVCIPEGRPKLHAFHVLNGTMEGPIYQHA